MSTTQGMLQVVEITLTLERHNVPESYSNLPRPVRVGIEATGSTQWFPVIDVAFTWIS